MKYQLTQNADVVICLDDGAIIPNSSNWRWQAYHEWLADGNEPQPAPSKTLEDYAAEYESAVQNWLDATACGNGYDSIASCATYVTSTNSTWAADAAAAVKWRDAVWAACYTWQASAQSAMPDPIPTVDQFLAQLPQPADYGWVVHVPGSTGDTSHA